MRSLQNVGSIFRTADAFAVTKVFLTGYTGTPPDDKITKTALGAEKTVPWEHHRLASKVINQLKAEHKGLQVVGLENNVKGNVVSLASFKPQGPVALVLGTETTGIPKNIIKLCDKLVEIPMKGQKESLNVAVAFGIAAYEIRELEK